LHKQVQRLPGNNQRWITIYGRMSRVASYRS
jgi:hypothetical protein